MALVLSGGGARGFAHIGILRAFDEAGLPVDLLTGTSMGAIVGTLFAIGYTPEQIRQIVLSLDWVKVFGGSSQKTRMVSGRYGEARSLISLRLDRLQPQVAPGLLPAQRVYEMLLRYTGEADAAFEGRFDSLMIPVRIVTADLKRGKLVVFDRGDLAKSLLASMAIPFLFAPVEWGDSVLVDGGLLDNTPVDVARAWGADVVLAVDVSSIGERDVRLDNLIDIFRRTMDIWMTRTNRLYAEKPDLLLRPYLEKRSPLDYPAADTMMALGYHYAVSRLDTLRKLLGGREEKWRQRRSAFRQQLESRKPKRIAAIHFEGNKHTRTVALEREIVCRPGRAFDMETICRDVHRLYATGLFDHVFAHFTRVSKSAVTLTFQVRESSRASLHFGASYRSRRGEAGFVQVRHRNLLGFGDQLLATWRFGRSRRFVALETRHRHFLGSPLTVRSAVYVEHDLPWLYVDAHPSNRLSIRARGASLAVGVPTVGGGLISLSGRLEKGESSVVVRPQLASQRWWDHGAGLDYVLDTRDDAFLPSRGWLRVLRAWQHGAVLGGSLSYRRIESRVEHSRGMGKWTWTPGLRLGLTAGAVPQALWFRLGGPDAFQGYDRDELWTPNFLSLGLKARYDYNTIVRLSFAFSANWKANEGSRLLKGRAEPGLSLGLKLVTPAGPLEVDLGYGEGGRRALYFSAGYPF